MGRTLVPLVHSALTGFRNHPVDAEDDLAEKISHQQGDKALQLSAQTGDDS
jgi:hypothetical protein